MDYELVSRPNWRGIDLKSYDVIVGGVNIGKIEGYYPTIEKKIPGKRYVAWRRTSKTLHWVVDYDGRHNKFWVVDYDGRHNKFRLPFRRRKDAVEHVISVYMTDWGIGCKKRGS